MSEQKRRADKRAHHIVYKTTCNLTGQYYIGMHSTDILEDGYLGSGWRLHRSIKKYGKESFVREVLKDCQTREEASLLEKQLITPEVLKDRKCLNLRNGGTGQMSGYEPPKETREKLSKAGKQRWQRERKSLKRTLSEELKNFSLTRDEILGILLTEEGQLNKNVTRHLLQPKKQQANQAKLNRKAAMSEAKWKFIWQAIQNPEFGDDPVELINAYVFNLKKRPTCKTCGDSVSFFRFNQPYATYCGASCQLRDPDFKNPVLARWEKQ